VSFPKDNELSDEAIDLMRLLFEKTPEKRIGMFDIMNHPWIASR
jgi:serine/threonine protein kinase